MEERLTAIQNTRNWKSKVFIYSRNAFAVIGVLAVLGLGAAFWPPRYSEGSSQPIRLTLSFATASSLSSLPPTRTAAP
jgi:hypothetical protein